MNFWKKLTKPEGEMQEDDGYNSYIDDGIVGEGSYLDSDVSDAAVSTPNVSAGEKVSLKLMQPKSYQEAPEIADRLMGGCIVVLDVGELQRESRESAVRLMDFLAGVIHVLNGQMLRSNKTTIVLAPSGVDISSLGQEEEAE